jgi:hypothetical protein
MAMMEIKDSQEHKLNQLARELSSDITKIKRRRKA